MSIGRRRICLQSGSSLHLNLVYSKRIPLELLEECKVGFAVVCVTGGPNPCPEQNSVLLNSLESKHLLASWQAPVTAPHVMDLVIESSSQHTVVNSCNSMNFNSCYVVRLK